MKKYYWDIESGSIVSAEELEKIRSEFYPEDSMEDFMRNCSYLHNGSIEPLRMEVQRQERLLRSMEEEVAEVRKHIEYLKELEKE